MNESPMTKVRRASSMREVMMVTPLMKIRHEANTSTAPTTAPGMMTKTVAPMGTKARSR